MTTHRGTPAPRLPTDPEDAVRNGTAIGLVLLLVLLLGAVSVQLFLARG